ncbi:MAG: ABC transporter substrate-binding protein, partial [Planctomycetota bacterium]
MRVRPRGLPLLLLCCFLASLAPAARTGEVAYPEDIRRIKERGRLVVAQFGGEREGFFAYDDAQESPAESFYPYEGRRLVGFDVDLAQRLADELGVELEIDRNYPSFDAVARGIAAGQADIAVSKLSMTTQRAQFVAYTNPYISLRMGLVVNRLVESRSAGAGGKTDTLGVCRRTGARVGVLDRSSFVKHGKDLFPHAELVPYPDQESLFRAVMDAEVLAVLYEEYEINKAMHRFPEMPIYCHTVFIPGREDLLAMAVHPDAQTLRELANMYMAKHNIAPTV